MSTVSSYQRSSKYSTAELALMGVRGHAYAIYHQLLNTINMKTGLCNPKHKTLAAKLQISVSTVRRHLKNLAELGLIAWRKSFHKVEHTGKYRQSSNEVVIYEVEDQLPNTCGDKNEQGGYSDRASINPQKLNKETTKIFFLWKFCDSATKKRIFLSSTSSLKKRSYHGCVGKTQATLHIFLFFLRSQHRAQPFLKRLLLTGTNAINAKRRL